MIIFFVIKPVLFSFSMWEPLETITMYRVVLPSNQNLNYSFNENALLALYFFGGDEYSIRKLNHTIKKMAF